MILSDESTFGIASESSLLRYMIGGGLRFSWGDGLGAVHWNSDVTEGLRCSWEDGLGWVVWRPDEVEGFGFGGRGVARRSCRSCLLWGAEVDSGEFFFFFHFLVVWLFLCLWRGFVLRLGRLKFLFVRAFIIWAWAGFVEEFVRGMIFLLLFWV